MKFIFALLISSYLTAQEHTEHKTLDYFLKALECLEKQEKRNPKLANFFILKALEYQTKNNSKILLGAAYKFLADSFYSGDGIAQSHMLALDYYKKSAQLNYAPAFFNCAAIYKEMGHIKKSSYWIKKYLKHPKSELKNEALLFLKNLKTH